MKWTVILLPEGSSRIEFERAIRGHILEQAQLTGVLS